MSRAFLIGAGVTKARYPTAPLSDDFLDKLKHIHGGLFNAIEQSLHGYIHPEKPLNKLNIEEIMKFAYKLKKSNKNQLLQSLYSAIHELLAKTTESTEGDIYTYLTGRRTTDAPLLRTLLVDKSRLTPSDFFMTLNYDLYLDREIISVNKSIDYGLSYDYMQINSGKDYPVYKLPITIDDRYSVYHLHGALNWGNTLNGKKIIIYPGAMRPEYYGEEANLCLIPPGMKEFNPVLNLIWKKAEEKLMAAHELIIIGCSLNPDDKELISMVHKFINKKGIDKVKIIHYRPDLTEEFVDNAYTHIIGNGYKGYRYGFNLNGPNKDTLGAIEFIFS